MIENIQKVNSYYDSDSGQNGNGYYSNRRKKEKQIKKNSKSKNPFNNLPIGKETSTFNITV